MQKLKSFGTVNRELNFSKIFNAYFVNAKITFFKANNKYLKIEML